MKHVVDRILHGSRELSLQYQRRDPLDDFQRCIEAINNRHTSNVVSLPYLVFFHDFYTGVILGAFLSPSPIPPCIMPFLGVHKVFWTSI